MVTRLNYEIAIAQTQCEIGDWFGNGLILAMSDFDLAFSEPDFLILSWVGPVRPQNTPHKPQTLFGPASCTMADYTLYLVTDSTPAILGDKDISDVVDRAIRGGVTVVQYRDKTSDTGALIATAKKLHAVTRSHNVPLLINDRVDVALAVGCEGVHLGQDDMGESTSTPGWREISGLS